MAIQRRKEARNSSHFPHRNQYRRSAGRGGRQQGKKGIYRYGGHRQLRLAFGGTVGVRADTGRSRNLP